MLRIRPEQVRILTEVTRRAFARKMADHLRSTYAAEVSRRLGDDDAPLAAFVEAAMAEAAALGIDTRDAVRRYLEDTLLSLHGNAGSADVPGRMVLETTSGQRRVDDPVESTPRRSLTCRFVETRVRCGDIAHIDVESHGLPRGTPLSIDVRRITDGAVLGALSTELDEPVTRVDWYPARFPGMTAHDGFMLQVSAADLSARGADILIFETPLPVGPESRAVDRRIDCLAWTGRCRISYDGRRVLIVTRIRLVSDRRAAEAGEALQVPVAAFIKAEAERFLTGRFGLIPEGCRLGKECSCVTPIDMEIDFVEHDEDHVVHLACSDLGPGDPRSGSRGSALVWPLNRLWRGQWAHAVGHLLGWPDDPDDPAGLMGGGEELREQDVAEVGHWLNARTARSWLLVRMHDRVGEEP